jgi:hypothetical protein
MPSLMVLASGNIPDCAQRAINVAGRTAKALFV